MLLLWSGYWYVPPNLYYAGKDAVTLYPYRGGDDEEAIILWYLMTFGWK